MSGLSRWGKWVEQKLAQPLRTKQPQTIGDQITLEAEQFEANRTAELIAIGIARRLEPHHPGVEVQCFWNALMAWHEVTVSWRDDHAPRPSGAWRVTHHIRDEDVTTHATSTAAWNRYLDERARGLRDALLAEVTKTRRGAANFTHPAVTTTITSGALGLQIAPGSTSLTGTLSGSVFTVAAQDQAAEEEAAIESIKQSLRRRGQ